jgi:general secretion pathway protein D
MKKNIQLLPVLFMLCIEFGILTQFCSSIAEPNQLNQNQEEATVSFNFENVNLGTLLSIMEKQLNVVFVTDNAIKGGANNEPSRDVDTVQISFKSQNKLTKKETWILLNHFLGMADLALSPMSGMPDNFYRVTSTAASNKASLKSYIGVDPKTLPDGGRIRYVYFLENSKPIDIKNVLDNLKSQNASILPFESLNALIFTDSVSNIKSLIQIVQTLDSSTTLVTLSVLKLNEADASEVESFYNSLREKDAPSRQPGFAPKKEPTTYFFPQDVKLIAEPRRNRIILIGPKEGVSRVESFITEHLDKQPTEKQNVIHIYQLEYAEAQQVADILSKVVAFGQNTPRAGGVRSGERYFKEMTFVAVPGTNTLVVRANKEDFDLIKPTIGQLDRIQPQVAIEVFIVNLSFDRNKALNSQIHNRTNGAVNFQTSGFSPVTSVVTNPTTGSLVTNLINLATTAIQGTTVLTLGNTDVWGILSVLDKKVKTNLVSNPFLTATNKFKSTVKLGEQRNVPTGTVISGGNNITQYALKDALLEVNITPQISSDGIINLDITVSIQEFTSPYNQNNADSGNTRTQKIVTNTNVNDGESIALGGIIRDNDANSRSGVPILSKIPIIGTFFSNKERTTNKNNLVIFITTKIIGTGDELTQDYTQNKAESVRKILQEADCLTNNDRDPIYRWFFKESIEPIDTINQFIPPCNQNNNSPIIHEKTNTAPNHQETTTQESQPISTGPIENKRKRSLENYMKASDCKGACS